MKNITQSTKRMIFGFLTMLASCTTLAHTMEPSVAIERTITTIEIRINSESPLRLIKRVLRKTIGFKDKDREAIKHLVDDLNFLKELHAKMRPDIRMVIMVDRDLRDKFYVCTITPINKAPLVEKNIPTKQLARILNHWFQQKDGYINENDLTIIVRKLEKLNTGILTDCIPHSLQNFKIHKKIDGNPQIAWALKSAELDND